MSLTAYEISALLEKEVATQSIPQRRKSFYSKFDQAAVFLLDLQPSNLFEPATSGSLREWLLRCKGCRQVITRPVMRNHHSTHKREYEAIRESITGRDN